jgi:hypothetical protein
LVIAEAAWIDLARTSAIGHTAHATVADGWWRVDGRGRRQVEWRPQEHRSQEDHREEEDGSEEHRSQEDRREKEDDGSEGHQAQVDRAQGDAEEHQAQVDRAQEHRSHLSKENP